VSSSVTKGGVFIAQKLNYSLPKFPFYPLTASILEYSLGRPIMLQHSTQISAITAVHSYNTLTVGPLHFASLHDPRSSLFQRRGSLSRLAVCPFGARAAPSLRAPPLRCARRPFAAHATPSLLFGEHRPSLVTLRFRPFGCDLFAFAARFAASLLAAEHLWR